MVTHHDVSQQLEPGTGRLVHCAGRHAVADVIAELLLRGTCAKAGTRVRHRHVSFRWLSGTSGETLTRARM